MVDTIQKNADALEMEIAWFFQVLDTRIKQHFGQETSFNNISEIPLPEHDPSQSLYGQFISHYEFSFAERIVLMLALLPYVRPEMLDLFLTKNKATGMDLGEFGGRRDQTCQGFLPTGQTALFLLADGNLAKRFSYHYLFEPGFFFTDHNIVTLESHNPNEPYLNGYLTLSREILDLITCGITRKPRFGRDFPARLIEDGHVWEDLVLDPFTMKQVLEIKAWIKHGKTLLVDLELGRKLKPGYRSLFYGPSGTGKTLTASLLGKTSGKDVYRVDLATVVSKYIGETEKNLEKIFHFAEHKNWILFFDEADALFGKRTKISDAHDRYANQEVSYLLQRVEDFSGIVILATNLRENLDEAFTRRFQSIIHFPMPNSNLRLKLWENAFSTKTELEENVDLNQLANQYEIPGGTIMNIVRYATLMALEKDSTTIHADDIKDGIHKEYQKEGKSF